MLRTKVILLNVTNLSDARFAAGMGVDYIGFSINPVSNNYVTAEDVKTITDWLSGVSLIGDIGSSLPTDLNYKVDYFLTDNPELAETLDEPILSMTLTSENQAEFLDENRLIIDKAAFLILRVDSEEIQNLIPIIKEISSMCDCYFSTDFSNENIDEVLSTGVKGIVLYGSHEEKPGLSNYDGIADVLDLLDDV